MMETIEVPAHWLENLIKLSKRVSTQVKQLPAKDHEVIIKTDISALIGYTASAEKIVEQKNG